MRDLKWGWSDERRAVSRFGRMLVFTNEEPRGHSVNTKSPSCRVAGEKIDTLLFQPHERPMGKIYNNIIETVGRTPLVKLNRIPAAEGVDPSTTIALKCEFFNPLGS